MNTQYSASLSTAPSKNPENYRYRLKHAINHGGGQDEIFVRQPAGLFSDRPRYSGVVRSSTYSVLFSQQAHAAA